MAYLHPISSKVELGAVQVGDFINVLDGEISLPQDISPNASVSFNTLAAATGLTLNGASVITTVTPIAGLGISIAGLDTIGPDVEFAINNTGVTSIVAGENITIDNATGTVTITATGSGKVKTVSTAVNYTAAADDEYIGGTAKNITITLPTGTTGKVYMIKNENAGNNITVSATAPEKIDGSVSRALANYASITVVFRAGTWHVI